MPGKAWTTRTMTWSFWKQQRDNKKSDRCHGKHALQVSSAIFIPGHAEGIEMVLKKDKQQSKQGLDKLVHRNPNKIIGSIRASFLRGMLEYYRKKILCVK